MAGEEDSADGHGDFRLEIWSDSEEQEREVNNQGEEEEEQMVDPQDEGEVNSQEEQETRNSRDVIEDEEEETANGIDIVAHSVFVDDPESPHNDETDTGQQDQSVNDLDDDDDADADADDDNEEVKQTGSSQRKRTRINWLLREEISLVSAVYRGISGKKHGVHSLFDAASSKVCPSFWEDVNKRVRQETEKSAPTYICFRKFRYLCLGYMGSRTSQMTEKEEKVFPWIHKIFKEGNTLQLLKKRPLKWASKLLISNLCENCVSKKASPSFTKSSDDNHELLKDMLGSEAKAKLVRQVGDREGKLSGEEEADLQISDEKSNRAIGGMEEWSSGTSAAGRLRWSMQEQITLVNAVSEGLTSHSHGEISFREVTYFCTYKIFWEDIASKLKETYGKCFTPAKCCVRVRFLKKCFLDKKRERKPPKNDEKELFAILSRMFMERKKGMMPKDLSDRLPLQRGLFSDHALSRELRHSNRKRKLEAAHQNGDRPESAKIIKRGRPSLADRNNARRCLSAGSSFQKERVGGSRKKLKWAFSDELHLVRAVKGGFERGIDGVKSIKDVLSFRRHQRFWDQIKVELDKVLIKPVPALKLYSKFHNERYRHLFCKKPRDYDCNSSELITEYNNILDELLVKPETHSTTPFDDKTEDKTQSAASFDDKTQSAILLKKKRNIEVKTQSATPFKRKRNTEDKTQTAIPLKQKSNKEDETQSAIPLKQKRNTEDKSIDSDLKNDSQEDVQVHSKIDAAETQTSLNDEVNIINEKAFNAVHQNHKNTSAIDLFETLAANKANKEMSGATSSHDLAIEESDDVKKLQRKLRKSQLMQELYKLEQEELEERIQKAKSRTPFKVS